MNRRRKVLWWRSWGRTEGMFDCWVADMRMSRRQPRRRRCFCGEAANPLQTQRLRIAVFTDTYPRSLRPLSLDPPVTFVSGTGTPGVTGSVMWDSGIVLGKFLEHAVDSGTLVFQGKKVVELGSGCGLVGCIAALLGAQVILTDLPDRLRLLKKNVETNARYGNMRGSATVQELTWGYDPDTELIEPLPDYVLGSDVIYNEEAVVDLLDTLMQLCGTQTTIILAGELRNDSILEYFLEAAMKDFIIGRVAEDQFHPDYQSCRVVMYVLVKK